MADERQMRVDMLGWYGMVMATSIPKAIGVGNSIMARYAGRGIWATQLMATLLAAVLFAVLVAAVVRLRANLTEGLQQAHPWLAKAVALAETGFHTLVFLGGTYAFVGHAYYFFLPETPLLVFLVVAATLAVIASRYGFEVMARAAVVGTIGHFGITLLMIPGVIWDVNPLLLFPIDEEGWAGVGLGTAAGLAEMLLPVGLAVSFGASVAHRATMVRHSFLAVLGAGLLVTIWSLLEITVMGPALTARQDVACMALARTAALGDALHRYELVMMLFFLPGMFLFQALPLYGMSGAMARFLGLGDRKGTLIPLALAMTGIAYWIMQDRLRTSRFFTYVWPPAVLAGAALLILATLLAAWLLGRKPQA